MADFKVKDSVWYKVHNGAPTWRVDYYQGVVVKVHEGKYLVQLLALGVHAAKVLTMDKPYVEAQPHSVSIRKVKL